MRVQGYPRAVERCYEDFQALSLLLNTLFPACALPSTPPAEAPLQAFQWFLRCILAHPTVSCCQAVSSFLLDGYFSQQLPPLPSFLHDMWSSSGLLECDIEENEEHIAWMREFFFQDRSAKAKLRECFSTFQSYQAKAHGYLLLCIQVIYYISNLSDTMPQNREFSGLWGQFGGILDQWKATGERIVALLLPLVSDLLAEQVKDYESIEKLLVRRSSLLEEYRDDKDCERFRDLYGHFNHQSKAELEILLKIHGEAIAEVFGQVKESLVTLTASLTASKP